MVPTLGSRSFRAWVQRAMATQDPTALMGGVIGVLVTAGKELVEDVLFVEKRGAELQTICLDDLRPLLAGILQSSSNLELEQLEMLRTFKDHIDNVSDRIGQNRQSRSYWPLERYVWSREIKDAERRIQAFQPKAVALCMQIQLNIKASLDMVLYQGQRLISSQRSSFDILTNQGLQVLSVFKSTLQTLVAPGPSKQLYGRETDTAHLKRLLLEDEQDDNEHEGGQWILVTGTGGIGKTFLVQCVCSLPEIRQHFEGGVFLVDLDKCSQQPYAVEWALGQLGSGPCLVVLDGARDGNLLVDPSALLGRNSKSRVVVTSWNRNVLTGTVEQAPMRIELGSLQDENSYRLFCWHAFQQHEAPPMLEQLAQRLASMCGGVPMALEIVGKAMRLKRDPGDWEDAVCMVAGGGPNIQARTRNLFRLSYKQLSWQQQRCFLVLTALQGYHHGTEGFIFFGWRVLGLVKDDYDAGRVLNDLIDTSLVKKKYNLLPETPETVDPLAWDVIREANLPFTRSLHDLSSSELACIRINSVDGETKPDLSNLKLLVLESSAGDLVISTRDARHLRLLKVEIYDGNIRIQELNRDLVFLKLSTPRLIDFDETLEREFSELEVLWLEGGDIQLGSQLQFGNFPKLRQLRLIAGDSECGPRQSLQVSSCPELRVLNASNLSLNDEAVEALGRLVNLEQLDFSRCDWPALVDLSFLANMPRLERLMLGGREEVVAVSASSISKCVGLRELHIPMVLSDINDFQQLLKPLSKLRNAKLGRIGYPTTNNGNADMEATQAIIRCSPSSSSSSSNPLPPLASFTVEMPLKTLPVLMTFTRLQYLGLGGCGIMLHLGLVDHPLDHLPRLRTLMLHEFATERISESFIGAATVGRLEWLKVSRFPSLVELRMPSAPRLWYLEIEDCHQLYSLESVCEWGLMSSLRHLRIKSCNQIKQLPASIAGLGSLERLLVNKCPEFERVLPPGCAGFPNLRYVALRDLESLHHIPELATHFPALCTIGGTLQLDSASQLDGVNLEDMPGFAKLNLLFGSCPSPQDQSSCL